MRGKSPLSPPRSENRPPSLPRHPQPRHPVLPPGAHYSGGFQPSQPACALPLLIPVPLPRPLYRSPPSLRTPRRLFALPAVFSHSPPSLRCPALIFVVPSSCFGCPRHRLFAVPAVVSLSPPSSLRGPRRRVAVLAFVSLLSPLLSLHCPRHRVAAPAVRSLPPPRGFTTGRHESRSTNSGAPVFSSGIRWS